MNKVKVEKITNWNGPLKAKAFPGLPTLSRNSNPRVEKESVFVNSFHSNKIICLNRRTGALRWQFDLGVYGTASPVTDRNSIYVGTNRGVSSLNKETGTIIWSYGPYSAELESFYSEPVKAGKNILISDRYGYLHCLNSKDGKVRYCVLLAPSEDADSINANVAVMLNKVYVVSVKGQLTCVDLLSGKIIWTKVLAEGSIRPPIVFKNRLFVSGSTCVFVVNLKSREVKKIVFNEVIDIAIKGSALFVLDRKRSQSSETRAKNTLYRYSGKAKKICDFSGYIKGFAAFKGRATAVVVGGEKIIFCDIITGDKKLEVRGIFSSLPAVTKKKIYFIDLAHEVVCVQNPFG